MSVISRRNFLALSATLGAGLLVGACFGGKRNTIFTPRQDMGDEAEADMLGWILIAPDNTIKIAIPSSEMGQGIYTGLALLVAEELDANFEQVQPVPASINDQFGNPKMRGGQLTGGSTSTQGFWIPMREAGATARAMLVQAAAQQWDTSPNLLRTENSQVIHPDGRILTYGTLASSAAKLDVPSTPTLKSASDYVLVGKEHTRLDTPEKVYGTATFGMDIRRPGMVYAAVQQARALRGRLGKVEGTDAVSKMPGVLSVHVFDTWVAVVAKGWWQAQQGIKALTITQDNTGVPTPSSADHRAGLLAALDDHGKAARGDEEKNLDVEYEVPLLEHATMSPMNCTAHVHAKGCDVWVPTQAQTISHETAAEAAGVEPEQVRIHTTFLGGGFGRRAEVDFVHQAVTLSKRMQKPVQVIWTREETTQHGYYRPAVISRFQVALNNKGDPHRWANQMALPNVLYQKVPVVPGVVWKITGDIIGVDGAKEPPYAHDDVDVKTLHVELDTPLGFWRAVGHSHNGFFVESVADELATLAGEDPAAYRRRLYGKHPRHLAVLNTVTDMAKWDTPRPKGRHLGIAVHESFGSVVGEVVELSVDEDKVVTLHRIWCAIHCGIVINPKAVRAQMESGIVYGLSAATRGKITLDEGVVQQSNFHDYQIMRLNEIPPIEVQLLESTDAPGGVGETALPPIAAAVGNAIYAATGQRLRKLPFSEAGFNTWRATRG